MTTELTTYDDFSPAQRQRAVAADLKSIAKDEKIILEEQLAIERSMVRTVNALARQGAALQRMRGHEQVTFQFIRNLQDDLPRSWGKDSAAIFDTAKKRVALTCRVPEEIKHWDDVAGDARRQILQQLELLQVMERGALGDGVAPAPKDPLTFFLNDVTRLKHALQKCWRERPIESRTKTQLKEFIADTQWLVDEREKANELIRVK